MKKPASNELCSPHRKETKDSAECPVCYGRRLERQDILSTLSQWLGESEEARNLLLRLS